MSIIIKKATSLNGELTIPGDKSVSHRAIMLGAISNGTTEIKHYLKADDCTATIECLRNLGVEIEETSEDTLTVHGKGMYGLMPPTQTLNVRNSGTTLRLLTSMLAGQSFTSELSGDDSINRKSLTRILTPLREMGATIESRYNNDCPPFTIKGGHLVGKTHNNPTASSQLKASILFAALHSEGQTKIEEPYVSRNHSELLIKTFGGNIESEGTTVIYTPGNKLEGQKITIPGDFSSAAYMITAGLIVPNSNIVLRNVNINPTRAGFLNAVKKMGASLTISGIHEEVEPCADIHVRSSSLHGITLEGDMIPRTLDEIPILAVLACFAEGTTVIKDATELKFKETNRIEAMVEYLRRMGADITETEDGMIIKGGRPLHGAIVGSRLDHRIAMSLSVAALGAEGKTEIIGHGCIKNSYPDFYNDLDSLLTH